MTMIPIEFVQTNKGSEQVWQRSKLRKTPIIRFKDYDVFAEVDGERVKVGRVYQTLATMERKTPGRMYVNARWHSPRWRYDAVGQRSYHIDYETRKRAAESLIANFLRERQNVQA